MLLESSKLSKNLAMYVALIATFSSCFSTPLQALAATSTSVSRATKAVTAKTEDASFASEVDASAPPAQDDLSVGAARGESTLSASNRSTWRLSKDSRLAYKLVSGFQSFANEREQSQYFGFGLGVDSSIGLMEHLNFRIRGQADLTTGYAQSRWGDNVGRSGFYLQEAVLSGRLIDTNPFRLYLSGGAIDQGAFDAQGFLARQAFPGLKETIVLGNSKAFELRVWAQQTIPTSKTLSTKTVDAEVTPSLFTETVEMSIKPIDALVARATITHFTFNNLPSAVALESEVYGNSVDPTGPNTARFKYRFEGFLASGSASVIFTPRFEWNVSGYAFSNAAAPESYRNAQWLQTGFKIGMPGQIDLYPTIAAFFIEDDATPGFYNSSTFGHNNRKGLGAKLEAFFQRQRFRAHAEYVDSELINPNINQSRQQTLSIGFETFYEML